MRLKGKKASESFNEKDTNFYGKNGIQWGEEMNEKATVKPIET